MPIAGKTGTTNDNFDAWFIGFTSGLAIGVYIGYDEPRSLGKYETGSKAALPIFKKFIEKALFKEDMKPFKSPPSINFYPVDYKTGKSSNFSKKKAIIEAFKQKTTKEINTNNLSIIGNYDKFNKFRRFY